MKHGEIKKRIYEIIEVSKEHDRASSCYDIMIYTAVLVGLLPLTVKVDTPYTKAIDLVTVFVFLVDYLLRMYTSDYKMGFLSYKAYIANFITPMALIDLCSIIPVLFLVFPQSKIIGMFRLFRIFRIFKLIRYSKTMVSIANVLRKVKKQLLAVLVLAVIYIFICAMLLFQVEPDSFQTFLDALYWATISITTVGYGDVYPVTNLGKVLTMLSSLMGVAIIALPSGIITAAYMEEIKKKKSKLEL